MDEPLKMVQAGIGQVRSSQIEDFQVLQFAQVR
jgi:hypothetical protein